jgi:hypothetical protein
MNKNETEEKQKQNAVQCPPEDFNLGPPSETETEVFFSLYLALKAMQQCF